MLSAPTLRRHNTMPAVYPKLRDDLIFSRQAKPDGLTYVVKDPVAGRFLRFKEPEYFIARQLDGVTPLEEIRRRGEEELGASLSQTTLERFAGKLQNLGLLEPVTEEAPRQPSRKAGRVRGNIFYLRFKVFDPDRLFGWLVPRLGFVFTRKFAW